jgi:hypothetical protein
VGTERGIVAGLLERGPLLVGKCCASHTRTLP